MIKKLLGVFIPVVLFFTFPVKADVPPEAGKVRVKIDLVIETSEDLADYRFFLDFYGDLREIEVKSKARTTIPPMGGGARYSSGTFLAIPKKSLIGFGGELSNEQLESLSKSMKNNEIAGVFELAKHRFSADIPAGEKTPEVYYVIKREGETLKSERISAEKPSSNPTASTNHTNSRTGLIVGGILIALAALVTGIFVFRKVSKKV